MIGFIIECMDFVCCVFEVVYDELLVNRYLEVVSIEGCGKKVYVFYIFVERGVVDLVFVVLLCYVGVMVLCVIVLVV